MIRKGGPLTFESSRAKEQIEVHILNVSINRCKIKYTLFSYCKNGASIMRN
jgi:hypothetical protein